METLHKIEALLKESKKSQKDLTDFLGIKKSSFSSWKAGRNTSYIKYLPQIAEFLNVSTDCLLGKESSTDPNETLMFALYGGEHADITPDMLNKIREFARFIREEEKRKLNDNK